MWNNAIIRGDKSSRDSTISIVRVFAFLFIITCHIMQYYDCELAWWFNVGVQMFLCLSGYLYGKKLIENELSFYKKQFIKILIPYYVVVIFAVIVQLLFVRNEITVTYIVKVLLCYGTLNGGEHLWFVLVILFCYILTPLFDKLNNRIFEKKYSLLYCFIVFVVLSVVIKLFVPYFNQAWIVCFYLGHVLGENEVKHRISTKLAKGIIYVVTMLLVSIQIVVSYVLNLELTGIIWTLLSVIYDYGHVFLGISIVLILLDVFRILNIPNGMMKSVFFLDYISYEGYLVRQFFILGPFLLLTIIYPPIIAIFVITLSSALGVKVISQQLKNLIK